MPRPRSARAHQQVLKAALDLISERGIDGMSMDAVAETSGVSKATIYKHWPGKIELCVEAIGSVGAEFPGTESGDPRADLVDLLRHIAHSRRPEALGRILPRILSAGNPVLCEALRSRFAEPSRSRITLLLERAIARGELRADLDILLAIDLLVGPIMHHRMMNTAVPQDLPERVVEFFWTANAPHSIFPAQRRWRKSHPSSSEMRPRK